MASAGTYIEASGLKVYYEVHGEGEPLLLLHGGTATCRSWASHLSAFAEHFRVFTPDSRGHGRTDNPTGELGYPLMADDVAASIGALGLERPLILGYSDGGQIALEVGMRYPVLVGALILGGRQFGFSEAYLEDALVSLFRRETRTLTCCTVGHDNLKPIEKPDAVVYRSGRPRWFIDQADRLNGDRCVGANDQRKAYADLHE